MVSNQCRSEDFGNDKEIYNPIEVTAIVSNTNIIFRILMDAE